jgi:hypothetical protein
MNDFLVEEVVRMWKSGPQQRLCDETLCMSFSAHFHKAKGWGTCW